MKKLISVVSTNKQEFDKDLDLVATLDAIYKSDQGLRMQIGEITKAFGHDSEEMKEHWGLMQEADSINQSKVTKILDEHGWLGSKVISDQGNLTLFLVIQHADLATQEKYLPIMREAVSLGNAERSNLALLEDRVAMRQGKQQIYGSQLKRNPGTDQYFVFPIKVPEKVNERRAPMGLGTIEQYIFQWDLEWDVEQHKKMSKQMGF